MSFTSKFFRTRVLILVALIAVSVGLATEPEAAVACEKCVFPTGGICVGCLASGEGYSSCVPDQSTCTCTVGGGNCELPIGP